MASLTIDPQVLVTTFLIPNLHCPSCVSTIQRALSSLDSSPITVSHSIVSHSVTIRHTSTLSTDSISAALEDAGFELYDVITDGSSREVASHSISPSKHHDNTDWTQGFSEAVDRWTMGHLVAGEHPHDEKMRTHLEWCELCRQTGTEATPSTTLSEDPSRTLEKQSDLRERHIDHTQERIVETNHSAPTSSSSSLDKATLSSPPPVVIDSTSDSALYCTLLMVEGMTCSSCVAAITRALNAKPWIQSADVSLLSNSATVTYYGKERLPEIVQAIEGVGYDVTIEDTNEVDTKKDHENSQSSDLWRASYAVGGMTCSSCVGKIRENIMKQEFVKSAEINLIAHNAIVVFESRDNVELITNCIEDSGYDATLGDVESLSTNAQSDVRRNVILLVEGMHCPHCPSRVLETLDESYGRELHVTKAITLVEPRLQFDYLPRAPHFTIRQIIASIGAIDPAFRVSIYHPPTLEERSRKMQLRERRRVLFRLSLAAIAAIPTFIIGIVLMSLVPAANPSRMFIQSPVWKGQVMRADWALFLLATPVYFFAADAFHRPAIREMRALWRPGSQTPILQRFYRFGSMNLLMSLGTTVAYFSSIAQLAISASQSRGAPMTTGSNSSYFDSVVFLSFFLLCGRFLEAYSKAKTGDAVGLLAKLRPTEALLLGTESVGTVPQQESKRVSVDQLEVGDVVRVVNGASPPSDGIIVDGSTSFDEASLTGESHAVVKSVGDDVFSGTVNQGDAVSIRITSISGSSMLDKIVNVVREGQTKRAPIERVADVITGLFVPVIVALAILTWILWLSLGLGGALPADYRGNTIGGWPLWSLQFAIAVFVVACPCGIGLAAPTALYVGGGVAAHHGILVKGGGEAFQEASNLDCVVFDKTGTLTQGGEPTVADHVLYPHPDLSPTDVLSIARTLEENSGHPVARAIVSFCTASSAATRPITDVSEVPGRGIQATFPSESHITAIIGNLSFLTSQSVPIPPSTATQIETFQTTGYSIALLAVSSTTSTSTSSPTYRIVALFATTSPLRPSTLPTIIALQRKPNLHIYILSGDHPLTTISLAAKLSIPPSNVIAGVLPHEKASHIRRLQRTIPPRRGQPHAIVAMVGDGINDAPALAAADVSIAIGSGSDIAIASASFILLNEDLFGVVTLLRLSGKVLRRVKFNFAWALVYNLIGVPVAAGVLYWAKTSGGTRVRLDPVWASLAMALSSLSVVTSSLLLRTKWWGVGMRHISGSVELGAVQVVSKPG